MQKQKIFLGTIGTDIPSMLEFDQMETYLKIFKRKVWYIAFYENLHEY